MSEKEKTMIQKISQLPETLQQRLLDQANGAAMAIEVLKADAAGKEEEKDAE